MPLDGGHRRNCALNSRPQQVEFDPCRALAEGGEFKRKMGEEYGETAPLRCFTSHADPELADAVPKARKLQHRASGDPDDFHEDRDRTKIID